ncbi:MAG: lipid-A-disaccharide synthase [Gammaproteobacteria bacterium]|jgi:lipid-A-disaccharide synthase|nr:lipid-A-disaccharide synthase [Gammaproteobacteria bacterium]
MSRILFIAGEASGDAHASEVAKALKQQRPDMELVGIGGQKMKEAGVEILFDAAEIAVVGLVEVIKHYPALKRAWNKAVDQLKNHRPDLLILVDYPGFNLRLAKVAKQMGIKVLYYISPQIWAWHQSRIKKIKQTVDHMAVIFPFEVSFYSKADIPVSYVGSPLAESVIPIGKQAAKHKIIPSPLVGESQGEGKIIGLLPGSRKSELSRLMPVLVECAKALKKRYPHAQFLLPIASTLKPEDIRPYISKISPNPSFSKRGSSSLCKNEALSNSSLCKREAGRDLLDIQIIQNNSHAAIEACDLAICSSGTVTLEAAILGTPMVLIYKTAPITYWLAKRLIKIKHIGLCNILAGKTIVPELIQNDANVNNIVSHACQILEDKAYRDQMLGNLAWVRAQLGEQKTGKEVAELALKLIN